jgi:ubiquinone/menaquinone biosynthesis C-methylase UbiE
MNEWRKKRRIMRSYDATAHIYDTRYAEEQAAKIEAALDDLCIDKHSLVLDAGCGTGILFDYVAKTVEEVVGFDISKKALLQAKKRTKNLENINLIKADADNMPLKEDIFAYVFAITLMQNVPSPAKTLEEIKRVARDNAIIVVTGMKKVFTLKSFEDMLANACLKIVALKEEGLKCYVAICAYRNDRTLHT